VIKLSRVGDTHPGVVGITWTVPDSVVFRVDAGVLSNKSSSGLLSDVSADSSSSFRFAGTELGTPAYSSCGKFIGYFTVDVVMLT
jgi:hypothetical protein